MQNRSIIDQLGRKEFESKRLEDGKRLMLLDPNHKCDIKCQRAGFAGTPLTNQMYTEQG